MRTYKLSTSHLIWIDWNAGQDDLELCNFKSLPVCFYWWCQALLLTNIPTSADTANCSMPPNNDADNAEVVWHHKTKLN